MKSWGFVFTVGASLLAACSSPERVVSNLGHAKTPSASLNNPGGIDIGDGRLPDLIVDGDATAKQWVIRDEQLDATLCSV